MTYRVFETTNFQREMEKVFSPDQREMVRDRLRSRIYPQLRKEPRHGVQIKKLRGYAPETWRYRVGNLRLFYSIDDEKKVVVMTAVRFRKDAYR